MYSGFRVKTPFFEIGPKAYLYGQASLDLALEADRLCEEYDVDIIYTPQYVDIRMIADAMRRLLVFAQHMDPLRIGRGIGSVLPEAIKAAGARGVLLNHSEKKMTLSDLRMAISRADEVGLATLVCADNLAEAQAIAQFEPNIILAEPPELIGNKDGAVENRSYVKEINAAIRKINPNISILHGAGIHGPKDVEDIILLGAEATGCTSGIIKAEDPVRSMREMIRTLRETWDRTR